MSDIIADQSPDELDVSNTDHTDHASITDYTQIAVLAQGGEYTAGITNRNQGLRTRLEHEKSELEKKAEAHSLITRFRRMLQKSPR